MLTVNHCYTPPFCFVKHVLVFTKDHNIHTFNHSFPIHSTSKTYPTLQIKITLHPNKLHTHNKLQAHNKLHTHYADNEIQHIQVIHENVGKSE